MVGSYNKKAMLSPFASKLLEAESADNGGGCMIHTCTEIFGVAFLFQPATQCMKATAQSICS